MPALPANGSAAEQPAKFRSFCECSADSALAEMGKVKELAARDDRAGLAQLGIRVGMSCASRPQ